jgi:hypothetical protein
MYPTIVRKSQAGTSHSWGAHAKIYHQFSYFGCRCPISAYVVKVQGNKQILLKADGEIHACRQALVQGCSISEAADNYAGSRPASAEDDFPEYGNEAAGGSDVTVFENHLMLQAMSPAAVVV